MPEPSRVELLAEELSIEIEVTDEIMGELEKIPHLLDDARETLGAAKGEKIILRHIDLEVERRLEERALERRRRGIR